MQSITQTKKEAIIKTVIICAHGELAPALLKSSAMIYGEHSRIHAVDFHPSEGTDDLVSKYKTIIADTNPEAVLFMVDFFGGSPYNAAIRIAAEHQHCDVITGVNLPMTMEAMMTIDDHPELPDFVSAILQSTSESIATYSGQSLSQSSAPPPQTSSPAEVTETISHSDRPTEGHMNIALLRIDNRLIHGQVATSWVKSVNCDAIFAISDEVAADEMRSELILQVAPSHLQSYVISVDKAIKVWHNPMYADRNILWLVTNPRDIVRLIQGGVDITQVNVGGMTYRQGCTMLSKSVAVDAADVAAFKELNNLGVEMTIQQLASHAPEDLMPKLNSINLEE